MKNSDCQTQQNLPKITFTKITKYFTFIYYKRLAKVPGVDREILETI